MTADGSILIITEIDSDGVKKGTKIIEGSLDGLGDSSKKAEEGIEGLWGQLFKADVFSNIASEALQKLGDKMLEFVADSIESAADVKASNAQFSQTFKDLESKATKSLENIAKETGVVATRMQSSYTKVFAFTKSVGADSEEAMEIANRAMLAAADSAAYYDTTIEEATDTLQSFLKGNYENDAALGIAATETTRNAKANELYAMSFDKLSESQKVDVLLAMVEAGNEASGALGSAAREAGEWTNTTGEATEAMRQLQAVIGAPILEALTPIIQSITNAIYEMIEATEADKLAENMEEITDSFEKAEAQFAKNRKEIEANDFVARHYINRLSALEKAGLSAAESKREYANIVSALNKLMPELNLQIDEQTGLVNTNRDAILGEVEAMKEKALYAAYEERLTAAMKAQADAQMVVYDAEKAIIDLETQRESVMGNLIGVTELSEEELLELYRAYQQYNSELIIASDGSATLTPGLESMASTFNSLTEEEKDAAVQLKELATEEARLKKQIDNSEKAVADYDETIEELNKEMDKFSENSMGAADANMAVEESADGVTESMESLSEEYAAAKEAARDSVDSQIGYFDKLEDKSSMSASKIVENWNKQKEAFNNYADNLQKAIDMGYPKQLVAQLSDGTEESMLLIDKIVNSTEVGVEDITAAWEGTNEARNHLADTMVAVNDEINKGISDAESAASAAGGEISKKIADGITENSGLISKSLSGIASMIGSALSGKKFSPIAVGFSETSAYSVDMASVEPMVPYLASGAVIPPNAPFLAMLGDQRHGTNIEAPLSTIQEAVDASLDARMGGMMAGFEAVVATTERLIETVENIEIGDTTIGEAANRYVSRMNIVRGGAR